MKAPWDLKALNYKHTAVDLRSIAERFLKQFRVKHAALCLTVIVD